VETLSDRGEIERFLRRSAPAQIYALADLDDAFWPDTSWFATRSRDGEIEALCLVLEKLALPIVHAVAPPHHEPTLALVRALVPRLPPRFFVNLPVGFERALEATHEIHLHGEFQKLQLASASDLASHELPDIETLGPEHADEIEEFRARRAHRPGEAAGGFYERFMLELSPWFGVRRGGELVAIAGVHVVSRRYGVAALGNVATAPEFRGRGLARAVCARLARELARHVPLVGLNVATANASARRCYETLGFRSVLRYSEALLTLRGAAL